jgi:predicted alpha/beta superfamily hydrolase
MADSDDNSIKQNQRKQDVIQRKKKKDRKGKRSFYSLETDLSHRMAILADVIKLG